MKVIMSILAILFCFYLVYIHLINEPNYNDDIVCKKTFLYYGSILLMHTIIVALLLFIVKTD